MDNMEFIEYDGEIIYYIINSEFMHCKYNKNGQLSKAQRIILFFDSSKNMLGTGVYYDDIDKVTNISRLDVVKVYKESIANKK